MLLTKKFSVLPGRKEKIILDCLCYASARLWNAAHYEKLHYEELGLPAYPNWYDQKKRMKDSFWYKNLPSQSAQEVLHVLEQGWRSFFQLKRSDGVEHPRPPHFKPQNGLFSVRFLNNGFCISPDRQFRFSLPRQLKSYLQERHAVCDNYLTMKIPGFSGVEGKAKQVEFWPMAGKRSYQVCIVYEIPDAEALEEDGRYLSIDLGLCNLLACYDSRGESFLISGAHYLNTMYYCSKTIARLQTIAYGQQIAAGAKYGKPTRRIKALYEKRNRQLEHYLHAATKKVADYCLREGITRVIIGDITGIRKNMDFGKKTNQKLHGLPFAKLYHMLEYKLRRHGILLVKQRESYSSQCSPASKEVSKAYACKGNRKKRGLYVDGEIIYQRSSAENS